EHFAAKFSAKLNKTVRGFTEETIEFLRSRQWKGNIREFENAIQRAVLVAKSDLICADDFMIGGNLPQGPSHNGSLRDMEMDLILKTLEDTKGNKAKAAKALGVSVRTIRNKLNAYGKKFPAA
ncbi:MAG: sigma-54-dependent Fis family transcriptional regulator, partial [Deferribacteres bacterium]|nr:sigma-54-dependent Fis family transcriptional regulator [Deferribacteres bacterium]